MNAIEPVERSALIAASAIHGVPIEELIDSPAQLQRIQLYSPMLFPSAAAAASASAASSSSSSSSSGVTPQLK